MSIDTYRQLLPRHWRRLTDGELEQLIAKLELRAEQPATANGVVVDPDDYGYAVDDIVAELHNRDAYVPGAIDDIDGLDGLELPSYAS